MKELLFKLVVSDNRHFQLAILFLRIFIGCMMLSHGWAKAQSFSTLVAHFPDPLGTGPTISLLLILCAEIGCSILLIIGLITRLATLPLIFGMLVVFFVVHGNEPFNIRELPLLYLGVYFVLLWAGGGRYSLDGWIARKINLREKPL